MLTIVGILLLVALWPARRMRTVAVWFMVTAGVLKMVVGLAPENTNGSLHVLGALNLPVTSVAILLLSLAIRRTNAGYATFGIIVALIGLIGTAFTSAAQYAGPAATLGLGNGGMERLAGYPSNIWVLVIGIYAITQATLDGFGNRAPQSTLLA